MRNFEIKHSYESRKKLLQDPKKTIINGIDYIEVKRVLNPDIQNSKSNNNNNYKIETDSNVSISKKTISSSNSSILLLLFLFKEPKTPIANWKENLKILGGTRIRNIGINFAGRPDEYEGSKDLNKNEREIINSLSREKKKKLIVIKPTQEGDCFSFYTLKLIENTKSGEPLANFDPIFSQIDFSFKVEGSLEFDCKKVADNRICPPVNFEEPLLDYMAKDYASFVKLILTRFSNIMPNWKEKSAADLTNVLIELLSYVGDHLSYYQDSVATEAYLGTARKRISVKRHARLLDYFIHEGSNARTWVCFTFSSNNDQYDEVNGLVLKKSTKLLTGESTKNTKISISEDDFKEIVYQPDTRVFETMHETNLYPYHNKMFFYDWGETDYFLPVGSTQATLLHEIKKNGEVEQSLDIRIFSWNTILDVEQDKENLKNFIMRISSIFHDKDSIKIDKEDNVNNREIIKIVDKDDLSKLISIGLSDKDDLAIATDGYNNIIYEFMTKKLSDNNDDIEIYGLSLTPGNVLILEEEVLSPSTLDTADRDPLHKQAVKLRDVKRKTDRLRNVNLVEISWDEEDALRFPFCINKSNSREESTNTVKDDSYDDDKDLIKIISVARGNVVLVDHGYTLKNKELEEVPEIGIFYPKLEKSPITFVSPLIPSASAYASIYSRRRQIENNYVLYPAILVTEGPTNIILDNNYYDDDQDKRKKNKEKGEERNSVGINKWCPARDLLFSDKFAKEFVVEIDNDNTVYLRFGDGENGQKPERRLEDNGNNNPVKFYATYRIGNGMAGNVGSDTIKRIVVDSDNKNIVDQIQNITNPFPAIGGTEQETLDEVRQIAPIAFMKQDRAVTEEDYVSILRRHPDVQGAVAIFRWTGSWYTVYATVDRFGGKIVDESFKKEIHDLLNKFRLAGYDLEINSPNYVPLDIEIKVCVKPNHYPEKVKENLVRIFSTQVLEDGQLGFFHPDNFTFGQPLYLSKIYQMVMNLDGVESMLVNKFQRMGKSSNTELEKGIIEVHHSEIIQVENDPNSPSNGKIEFVMEGGI